MSATVTHTADDGSLRRVRSTGDMPRRPERLFIAPSSPIAARRTSEGEVQSHIPSTSLPASLPTSLPVVPPATTAANQNQNQTQNQNQDQDADRPYTFLRLLAYLGMGRDATQARKARVVLVWNGLWSLAQIVVITTMVAMSGTVFQSPVEPGTSEWIACDRPLGVWACLWIVRVMVATGLTYWEYVRERAAIAVYLQGGPSVIRRGNRTTTTPAGSPTQLQSIRRQGMIVPPPNPSYTRLSVLASLLTLSWFLTAHILEYTSINTCRHTSPHLWWLVFGILCIMYLMVFEVVVIGFIVLVITPIIFVFWNILLICLGRHPIQNPHIIRPDIDKIPKSVVETIPLVMYIPPPPEGADLKPNSPKIITHPHSYPPKVAEKPASPPKHRFKFIRGFSKNKAAGDPKKSPKNSLSADVEKNPGSGEPLTWSDYWEESEYPFVVLEGNRAACAICLMDFEEPKRKPGMEHSFSKENKQSEGEEGVKEEDANKDLVKEEETGENGESAGEVKSEAKEEVVREETPASQSSTSGITLEERTAADRLRLEDAGEAAQPLRLLTCGHVFHKTCLDPWLTDVSGRCPVCQQPVEVPGRRKRRSRDRPGNAAPP